MNRLRAGTLLALAVALTSAGCGTTLHRSNGQVVAGSKTGQVSSATTLPLIAADGSVTPGATTPGGAAIPGAQQPGTATTQPLTAKTGPISLGFLLTETGNAGSLGISTGQAFTHRQVTEALVKAMNAKGGIAGRQIKAVLASTDTASVSWETDFAAACASFTQDNKVTAVLGYAFVFFDSFESCLSRAGVVHLSTTYNASDDAGLAQYPLLYALAVPTWDRYYRVAFQGAVSSGFMKPSNALGVIRGGCPSDRRAWERTAVPLAKALKINIAAEEELACITGASGAGGAVTQIQSAVLRFRSRGVDTVMVEGPPAIIFSSAAESQGWRPRYLATSESGGAALTGNVAPEQLRNFHGFGWLPSLDVLPVNGPARNAAQLRCLDLLKSQGLNPTQHGDFTAAFATCDAVFLYEAALTATKGNDAPTQVAATIDAMGTRYQSAFTHGGQTRFGGRHDAPAQAQPWAWNDSCGCFKYILAPYAI